MARTRPTLALCMLLSGAPLLAAGSAVAEPAGTPERSAAAAPAEATPAPPGTPRTGTTSPSNSGLGVQRDMAVPATPIPMNLPDDAKQSEVRGETGIGVAGLILGALVVVAIVVGGLFLVSRRNWSTQH